MRILQENYNNSFLGSQHPRRITGKFLLLHTMSHLLIKQLSFECGYNISSLKERIYCGEASEGKEMAGILIYTASGDSEGTLGGLVRQGWYDTFPRIYKKAVESAVTCSNDPICLLSSGQGRDSLNLSACYSCGLLPETCCEEFNVFLDRGVIVGTYENRKLGFFREQLYENAGWKACEGNLSDKRMEENNPEFGSLIMVAGTDMREEDWSSVLSDIFQFAETDGEREFSRRLTENGLLRGREMPFRDVKFTLSGNATEWECDYCWPEQKILYFSYGQEPGRDAASAAGMKCIYGPDGYTEKAEKIIKGMK